MSRSGWGAVKRPPDTAIPLKADMEPGTDCPAREGAPK